ncbi:50S ribosomal protein L21 [Candidatus Dojkabacteria bacterium]|nr:50S ribosomal protein L21 [Candidatus Dojkabacteria bacterium]
MKKDFAIVKIGSTQEIVCKDDEIVVNIIKGKEKDKIEFDQVLLSSIAGKIVVGTPYIKEAKIKAEILGHELAEKVQKRTYKAKARIRRNVGHRQPKTRIKILSI